MAESRIERFCVLLAACVTSLNSLIIAAQIYFEKVCAYILVPVVGKILFVQKSTIFRQSDPPPPILSVFRCLSTFLINFSTTNENPSCHRNLAARYQLVQTVLKTGSMLAERMGQERSPSGRQCIAAVAAGWSASCRIFSSFPAQNAPLNICRDSISGTVGNL